MYLTSVRVLLTVHLLYEGSWSSNPGHASWTDIQEIFWDDKSNNINKDANLPLEKSRTQGRGEIDNFIWNIQSQSSNQYLLDQDQQENNIFHMSSSGSRETTPECTFFFDSERFACNTDIGINKASCERNGCCWDISSGAPSCFYPKSYPGFNVTDIQATPYGYTVNISRMTPTIWPWEVYFLRLDIYLQTADRLHFKIYDPNEERYEVPIDIPEVHTAATNTDYDVVIGKDPFTITITRKTTGAILFDSRGAIPLIYADQFIQFGTKLSSNYVYGLGEHQGTLHHNMQWTKVTFWAKDQNPHLDSNLYGVHPFYLNLEDDGNAHGVLMLNSNAMEVELQPLPALTYRTTGGILDFYVFSGPSPDKVISQYTNLFGRPYFPPFWALGFHLCKYGYRNDSELRQVIERNRAAEMPYDTQWTDIDYMKSFLDFTVDDNRFSQLPDIVQDLHDHGQHYVIITDPGISNTQPNGTYKPYDDGLKDGVFILNENGTAPLIGKVWPGLTAYPDFFHPLSDEYWEQQVATFHDFLKFDALWIVIDVTDRGHWLGEIQYNSIALVTHQEQRYHTTSVVTNYISSYFGAASLESSDMNEPSNFIDGSTTGCLKSSLNNPPFLPTIAGGHLSSRTICPAAKQYISTHYNLHNMYGYSEMRATIKALHSVLGNRSMVISRSTFPGSGVFGGHWTGDIHSVWDDLYYSIPEMLNFQMFGISFVGADVCGFGGNTTPELCTRWMQVGAFYPFMRNHDARESQIQDPASFDTTTQGYMRKALQLRYTLLPYLYALLFRYHNDGAQVARPLFFQYPELLTFDLDTQFMWGSGLHIIPVVKEGALSVEAFLPNDTWYDFHNLSRVLQTNKLLILPAPIDMINLHIRGGSIIPTLPSAVTTTLMRQEKFSIIVALSSNGTASGELYWDDGQEIDAYHKGNADLIIFKGDKNNFYSQVSMGGYSPSQGVLLGNIEVLGVPTEPNTVLVNNEPQLYLYDSAKQLLRIVRLSTNMLAQIHATWS